MALAYAIAALFMAITIIGIPFAIQALKIANFALWPFGRTLVKRPTAGAGSAIGNVLWFVLAGWWLAIGHMITAAILALTIIGLPLAAANIKLIPVSLLPFGREIVPNQDVTAALAAYRAQGVAAEAVAIEMPSERSELPRG